MQRTRFAQAREDGQPQEYVHPDAVRRVNNSDGDEQVQCCKGCHQIGRSGGHAFKHRWHLHIEQREGHSLLLIAE